MNVFDGSIIYNVKKQSIINGANTGMSNSLTFDFDSLELGVYDIYVYLVSSNMLKNYARYIKWFSTVDNVTKETIVINSGESLSINSNTLYTGSWYSKVYMYKIN